MVKNGKFLQFITYLLTSLSLLCNITNNIRCLPTPALSENPCISRTPAQTLLTSLPISRHLSLFKKQFPTSQAQTPHCHCRKINQKPLLLPQIASKNAQMSTAKNSNIEKAHFFIPFAISRHHSLF